MNHKRMLLEEILAKHKRCELKIMENRGNSKVIKILTVNTILK